MEKLQNSSMKPIGLPLVFLENITNGFSDDQILGRGGYGQVYKGVDKNGRNIAVKKLYDLVPGFDNEQFTNEFNSLMKVRHQNIVRLVGYCYEKREILRNHEGEFILCKVIERVLCLEYLKGGSLDKHLNEESAGHDWPTRLRIIKGICEGLNYLHGNALGGPIFHLDLKPENILLDKNMMPKIADFGLSRLFGGTQTHTTRNGTGTPAYMPPEFILKHQISEKYDVFSLGIIIIEIMTGQGSYSKYADMTSQSFVEQVCKNWRERIESTQRYESQDDDCHHHQVKRCIELALRCVEPDRHNRPSVNDIMSELKRIDTNGSTSPCDQAAKIGQWGGIGGNFCDIQEPPSRLRSLIIGSSGTLIYSLQFSYDGYDGNEHIVGPWGGWGPHSHEISHQTINLSPLEAITEVHGTTGSINYAQGGVVKSLTIITNSNQYGPFGEVKGTPFRIPVRSDGSIVGFFARTGWFLDAIGVYVKPKQEMEGIAHVEIGPWGGTRGQLHDIEVAPKRLESMTVSSAIVIDSITFSYLDHDGKHHTAGPWGGLGGSTHTIQFGLSEFLTGFYGTTGPFTTELDDDVVTSLTLVTNVRSYGPFGEGGGNPFETRMWDKGSILGFFGRADLYVNAIGVYASSNQEAMKEMLVCSREPGLTKVGPWGRGGDLGSAMDINIDKAAPHRLERITISYGGAINSISFSYTDFRGDEHDVGPWGIPAGETYEIIFDPLEIIDGVSGTIGSSNSASPNAITSLTFVTHKRQCGPIGPGGGTRFSAAREADDNIVGFFGRAGTSLDSIGVYMHRY